MQINPMEREYKNKPSQYYLLRGRLQFSEVYVNSDYRGCAKEAEGQNKRLDHLNKPVCSQKKRNDEEEQKN
jgi:hypothetical protein